jgi:hypothetical protein
MKAIADLANVLKRKPTVTAKQEEQEIQDLQCLMENTHLPTPLPRVTEQQDKQALPRVQTKAILPRVQTEAITPRVPETAQDKGKQATRSTSKLPVATEQRAPRRKKQTNIPHVNVENTKKHKLDQPRLN